MNRRDALKSLVGATATVALASRAQAGNVSATTAPVADPHPANSISQAGLEVWLATSLQRVYPTSTSGDACGASPVELRAFRNFRLSFQACVRNLENSSATVECAVAGLDGVEVRIRRVGTVPMHHLDTSVPLDEIEGIGKIPGLCPDPLYPESTAHLGPQETGVFWVSLNVLASSAAGLRKGTVSITLKNRFGYVGWDNPPAATLSVPFSVDVADVEIKPRKDFQVTLWMSADSIWEHYRIEPCGEPFWALAEKYMRNLVEHGVDVMYTPIFNIRAEQLKRPAQLLRVQKTGDAYTFDFTDVRRWIQLAMKSGAQFVEFSHFFSPAPESAAYPQKIYARAESIGELLWPANTPATSETFHAFLSQFLPQFKKVLEEEGVLDKSLFHLADEPDGADAIARYRAARALLQELAPWIKVMDAMSDPHFATERLSDMPIPSIATAAQFAAAKCPAWVYYCCGPRQGYIQRLLDTPLWKIRMTGLLFYKLGARGFLHWGYNYWFRFCTDVIADPFADATNGAWPGMPYGDTFAVYPGAEGPIDSIRWEVFGEALQDYAVLQTLGIQPGDATLSPLKDYNDFPKSFDWIATTLRNLSTRA